MDIYCSKCGEPWEIDTLHDVAEEIDSTFKKVLADFRKTGCSALGDYECSEDVGAVVGGLRVQDAQSVLFDLLGDDIDGVASELADLGF